MSSTLPTPRRPSPSPRRSATSPRLGLGYASDAHASSTSSLGAIYGSTASSSGAAAATSSAAAAGQSADALDQRLSGMLRGVTEEHRLQMQALRSQQQLALEQKDIELSQVKARVQTLLKEAEGNRSEMARKEQEKNQTITQLQEQVKALQGEVRTASASLQKTRANEGAQSERAASLANTSAMLRQMNETYQATIEQLQHERGAIQTQFESTYRRYQELLNDKSACDVQLREAIIGLDDTRRRNEELISQHTRELDHHAGVSRELKDKLAALTKDNEGLRRVNANLDFELREMRIAQRQEEKMLERIMVEQRDEHARLVQVNESQVSALQTQLDTARHQSVQLQGQLRSMENARDLLQQEVRALKSQIDSLKDDRQSMETMYLRQLEEIRGQSAEQDRTFKQINTEKSDELQAVHQQMTVLQDHVAQLTTELHLLKKTSFDDKLRLESEIADLRLGREQLQRELQEHQMALQRKNEEISSLHNKGTQMRSEHDRASGELESKLKSSYDENQGLRDDIEELSMRLHDAQNTLSEATEEINLYRLRLQAVIREKDEVYATKQMQQEAMDKTASEYRMQIARQQDEILRLQTEVSSLTTQKEALERDNMFQRSRIAGLESDMNARGTAHDLEAKRYQDEVFLLKEQITAVRRESNLQLVSLQTQVRTLEAANNALNSPSRASVNYAAKFAPQSPSPPLNGSASFGTPSGSARMR